MQCTAITKTGVYCANKAKPGHTMCGIHLQFLVTAADQCVSRLTNGRRCNRKRLEGDEHHHCSLHRKVRLRREEEKRIREEIAADRLEFMRIVVGPRFDEFTDVEYWALIAECIEMRRRTGWSYTEVLDRIIARRNRGDEELINIANDSQSVHRTVISTQTNKGLDILFKFAVSADQDTMKEIESVWRVIFTKSPVDPRLYDDMKYWYEKSWCRNEGDYMYKRVLDHAWAAIKTRSSTDEKLTLYIRLQQECAESYGMCCDGHINRIVNAFVGFIDDIAPPVPTGEILQDKMAKIAELEDLEERIIQATHVFHELGVTADAAGPWLEALA